MIDRTESIMDYEREAARDARDAQDYGRDDDGRPSRQELRDEERDHAKWLAAYLAEGWAHYLATRTPEQAAADRELARDLF